MSFWYFVIVFFVIGYTTPFATSSMVVGGRKGFQVGRRRRGTCVAVPLRRAVPRYVWSEAGALRAGVVYLWTLRVRLVMV